MSAMSGASNWRWSLLATACWIVLVRVVSPSSGTGTSSPPPTSDAICYQVHPSGSCSSPVTRYFYEHETGVCRRFQWQGCQAIAGSTGNMFETEDDCISTCNGTAESDEPINLTFPPPISVAPGIMPVTFSPQPADPVLPTPPNGDTNFKAERDCFHEVDYGEPVPPFYPDLAEIFKDVEFFFFNSTSRQCELFNFLGLGGNHNNFQSKEECVAKCGEFIVNSSNSTGVAFTDDVPTTTTTFGAGTTRELPGVVNATNIVSPHPSSLPSTGPSQIPVPSSSISAISLIVSPHPSSLPSTGPFQIPVPSSSISAISLPSLPKLTINFSRVVDTSTSSFVSPPPSVFAQTSTTVYLRPFPSSLPGRDLSQTPQASSTPSTLPTTDNPQTPDTSSARPLPSAYVPPQDSVTTAIEDTATKTVGVVMATEDTATTTDGVATATNTNNILNTTKGADEEELMKKPVEVEGDGDHTQLFLYATMAVIVLVVLISLVAVSMVALMMYRYRTSKKAKCDGSPGRPRESLPSTATSSSSVSV